MRKLGFLLVALVVALGLTGVANAAWSQTLNTRGTVTTGTWPLHPYRDSYINEAATTTNYGASINLLEGQFSGKQNKALIKFDLSSLAGKTITSATLRLYAKTPGIKADTVVFHRLLKDWVEGDNTSGSGVTWKTTNGSTSWGSDGASSAGVDYNSANSASLAIAANSIAQWYDIPISTTDVQSMINTPANNFGWIFYGNFDNSGQNVVFSSGNDSLNKPELKVSF